MRHNGDTLKSLHQTARSFNHFVYKGYLTIICSVFIGQNRDYSDQWNKLLLCNFFLLKKVSVPEAESKTIGLNYQWYLYWDTSTNNPHTKLTPEKMPTRIISLSISTIVLEIIMCIHLLMKFYLLLYILSARLNGKLDTSAKKVVCVKTDFGSGSSIGRPLGIKVK